MDGNSSQLCDLSAQPLASDDLLLTPVRRDDADAMLAVLDDRELYRFTGEEPPSIDELRRRFTRQSAGVSPDGSQRWLNWIVRVSGEPTGYVQATVAPRDERAVAELAWVIGVRWQGQSLATRSTRIVHTWLRDQGVRRFVASIHPDHAASAAVAARLGFHRTETLADDGELIWRMP